MNNNFSQDVLSLQRISKIQRNLLMFCGQSAQGGSWLFIGQKSYKSIIDLSL